MRQILYLGTYERDYPRNALTIAGLRRAGYRVRELHAPVWELQSDKSGAWLRLGPLLRLAARLPLVYLRLLARLPRALRGVDLVVIGYIGQSDMLLFGPLLRLLGRPILFNPLLTLTDTLVEDRALMHPGSYPARLLRLIDRLSLALADAVLVDTASTSSWEEAVNTLQLMRERNWTRVVVISDPYHMRRLDWIWSRVFRGSGRDYSLVASAPPYWQPDRWWMSERAGASVIMEYIKLVYYFAKY